MCSGGFGFNYFKWFFIIILFYTIKKYMIFNGYSTYDLSFILISMFICLYIYMFIDELVYNEKYINI